MKELVRLVLCIAMSAMEPLFAVDVVWEDPSQHLSMSHTCSVCTRNDWVIDPNDKGTNGDFNPIPNIRTQQIMSHLPTQSLLSIPLVSKKMSNIMNDPNFWEAMDALQSKVHLSTALCPKTKFLENYRSFSELFKSKFDYNLNHSERDFVINGSTLLHFMETPCESGWYPEYLWQRERKETDRSYTFSIGSRQFELFVNGDLLECIEILKNSPDCIVEFYAFYAAFPMHPRTFKVDFGGKGKERSFDMTPYFIKELPPPIYKYAVCKKGRWKTDIDDIDCLNLFKEHGKDVVYAVKASVVFSFVGESRFDKRRKRLYKYGCTEIFGMTGDPQLYSFSIGDRQFELRDGLGRVTSWLEWKDSDDEITFDSIKNNSFEAFPYELVIRKIGLQPQ